MHKRLLLNSVNVSLLAAAASMIRLSSGFEARNPHPMLRDPGAGPKFRMPASGRIELRRQEFIDEYNRNPMNFLPGNAGRAIYRKHCNDPKRMHDAAQQWIKSFNEWAPPDHRINWPVP